MNNILELIKSYQFAKNKYHNNLDKLMKITSRLFAFLVILGVGFKFLPIFCLFFPVATTLVLITISKKFKEHLSIEEKHLYENIQTELSIPENKERVLIIKDIIELQEDDILEDPATITTDYLIKDIMYCEEQYQKYANVEINKLIKLRDDLVKEKLNDLTKAQEVLEKRLSPINHTNQIKQEQSIFQVSKNYLSSKL